MDLTPPPLQSIIADAEGKIPAAYPAWATWFGKLALIVNASVQSGTTANRPTTGLYIGRPYFDTSLAAGAGKPIWVKQLGTVLWADATGATV